MSQAAIDLIEEALNRCTRAYQQAFDAPPTVADLSALLSAAVGTFFDAPARVTLHPPGQGPAAPRPASQRSPPPELEVQPARVGDVLALELDDGRLGVARILQVARRGYVVEALDGVFEAPPTLDQVRALERLREHGGPFAGQALVRHVDGEPPASARLLGRLLPTVAQYREAPRIYEEWSSVTGDILRSTSSRRQ